MSHATAVGVLLCAALALSVAALVGCRWARNSPTPGASGVAPLDEAEFDRFASRVARRMERVLADRARTLPVSIARPIVDATSVEPLSDARAFARRLVAALSDRLRGAVRFEQPADGQPRLRARVTFEADQPDTGARVVMFSVNEDGVVEPLLREGFEYDRMPFATATMTTAVARPDRIRIDYDGPDLAGYVRTRLGAYRQRIVRGANGMVVFLDGDGDERFWVREFRSSRRDDGALRVELDIRARGRRRDARLRVLFFDEDERDAGSTSTMPYRFVPLESKIVVSTSPDERADRFIALLKAD